MAQVIRFPSRHQPAIVRQEAAEVLTLPAVRIERAHDAVIIRDRGGRGRQFDRREAPDIGGDVA